MLRLFIASCRALQKRAFLQWKQRPQAMSKQVTTRSPTATFSTPAPTSCTVPMNCKCRQTMSRLYCFQFTFLQQLLCTQTLLHRMSEGSPRNQHQCWSAKSQSVSPTIHQHAQYLLCTQGLDLKENLKRM